MTSRHCRSITGLAAVLALSLFLGWASVGHAQGTLFVEGNNVGIGTDTPSQKLHIIGTTSDTALLIQQTGAESSPIPSMVDLIRNGRAQFRLEDTSADGGNPWTFATREGSFQINELNDGGQNDFILNSAGDLTIAGSLRANGGSSSFPDYVFDPSYELMPIDELAEFVRRERHLPKIPSAESVRENGGTFNMTELQLRLLEKVEELTLYVVQLKEETDQLRAENATLREAVEQR